MKNEKEKTLVYDSSYLPADVPKQKVEKFKKVFNKATGGSGNLMLFAGDQKLEHLNADFFGKDIADDDADPIHLFNIAAQAKIGVFATQLGLISRYARRFLNIPYLVKLNSKTNLVPYTQQDPISRAWFTVDQVVAFSKSAKLNILGVGYTIYLGSNFEAEMLKEAAQIVHQAHLNGLISVLWIYPKGNIIKDEHDVKLIAGAAGVAASLGADFVKLKVPFTQDAFNVNLLNEVIKAAGNTGVLCEGGAKEKEAEFLKELHTQIKAGTRGSGTGRNIHQRPLKEAIAMANAIYKITVEQSTVAKAMKAFK